MFELGKDNFIQPSMAVEVQVSFAVVEVHGKEQAHQAQVVVAMQVGDEDVTDAVPVGFKFHELHLGAFTTINQHNVILDFDQLS